MSSAWYHEGSKPPIASNLSRLNIEHGPLANLVRRGLERYFDSISIDLILEITSSARPKIVLPVTATTSSPSRDSEDSNIRCIQSDSGLTSISVMANHSPFDASNAAILPADNPIAS